MPTTGKTGADGIFKAIKRVAIIVSHYAPKFLAVIAVMEAGGQIQPAEATVIREFLSGLNDLLAALSKVSDYSGF